MRARNGLILVAILALAWVFVSAPKVIEVKHPPKPVPTKATMEDKGENRILAKEYASASYGWKGKEWVCLNALWSRESRFDNYAKPLDSKGKPRSTAYGIAQLLGERSSRADLQILRGLRYIHHRHSSPCQADRHSLRKGWY